MISYWGDYKIYYKRSLDSRKYKADGSEDLTYLKEEQIKELNVYAKEDKFNLFNNVEMEEMFKENINNLSLKYLKENAGENLESRAFYYVNKARENPDLIIKILLNLSSLECLLPCPEDNYEKYLPEIIGEKTNKVVNGEFSKAYEIKSRFSKKAECKLSMEEVSDISITLDEINRSLLIKV